MFRYTRLDRAKHVVLVPRRGGGQFEWTFLDPAKLVSLFVEECPPVAKLFRDAVAARPPSIDNPWHLVIGFDEFAPGNKLKVIAVPIAHIPLASLPFDKPCALAKHRKAVGV